MAFRSPFRNAPPKDTTTSQTEPKAGSRMQTKTSSSHIEGKSSKSTQHASKLSKRASRTITPTDKRTSGANGIDKGSAAVAGSQLPAVPPKKAEVVPTSGSTSRAPLRPSKSQLHNAPQPPPNMRTPSLVSGSSASTFDSPRTYGLRRKPSTIESYAASRRAGESTIGGDEDMLHRGMDNISTDFEDTVLGISLPQTTSYVHHGAYVAANPKDRLPSETDQPLTRDITPPVPSYAQSATPSTRYTGSPFSHVPTPSSASSYSPAVFATTSGSTPRMRQPSPTQIGANTTSRASEKTGPTRLGLSTVRESSTSSSNSTSKPAARSVLSAKDIPRKSATAPPTGKATDGQYTASRSRLVKEKPRQSSTPSSAKPTVQIPPELAHLIVDPPRSNLNKALPPIRPSRDGTPNLTGLSHPSPVVQSDLPRLYNTYHKRTPSQESNNPLSPTKSRFGISSRTPSRQESPRVDSAISPPPAARAFARGPTPNAQHDEVQKMTRKDSPAIGPGPSPSKSPRFGFFSRKPKESTPKPPEKPKRQPTKGPVAGTGHEGYGRFGFRGRSGSNTSSADFRSPSADSTTSSQSKRNSQGRKSSMASNGSDWDEFLRERLNPVVLRGSGSTVSNVATESDAPSTAPDSKTSSLDSYTKPQLLPSAIGSDIRPSPAKRPYMGGRAPSDSNEDNISARYPTLAARRSVTKLSQGEGLYDRTPAPIATDRPSKDFSRETYDAQWPTVSRFNALPRDESPNRREGDILRSQQADADARPSRRWNFFQRAHASPSSKGKEKATNDDEIPVSVIRQSPYRSAAPYTTLDPVEPVDLEEVERIVQESETSPEDSMSESNAPPKMVPYEGRHKSLLPSPPQSENSKESHFRVRPNLPAISVRQEPSMSSNAQGSQQTVLRSTSQQQRPVVLGSSNDAHLGHRELEVQQPRSVHTPEMAQTGLNTPENQMEDSPQRQPRLSPIGRIPKVISKRDRDRKLSDSSFSRPFGRTQPQPQPKPTVQPPGSLYSQIRELASPIESGSQPVSSTSTRSDGNSGDQQSSMNTNAASASTNRTSMDIHSSDFFAFPPRKDSDLSYSSSSGNYSWTVTMGPPPPQEEDVWHEYNDLLDDVMPQRTPLSTSSSFGAPFQYSSMLYDPDNSTTYPLIWGPPMTQLPLPPAPNPGPTVLSVPQQVARFMQPSMSPLTTPNQLADFVDHYGNRSTSTLFTGNGTSMIDTRRPSLAPSNRSSIPGPARASMTRNSRSSMLSARGSAASSRHSRASGHSRSASLPEAHARNSQSSLTSSVRFNRETQLLDIAEVEGDDQAAAANLRFGALMTSKWLSFGRVLFSPADNEMRLANDPKILILDGLGSDWSFYVALAYPAATVYNLGPAPISGSAWPGVNQKPPPNHRHINHTALSAAFPFPKGFFSAVVFRFPLVTTDEAYHSCIFECKRVLRPGGYLEVAVLDLDLMNMGSRARKAVRGLKTRMQEKDNDLSLRNLSDVLVRFIGRRGFEEVQRCIVGVPAAGRIPRSQDISSISSGASGKPVWHREEQDGQEFSFADLLEDARSSSIEPGKKNDESITKMVAKVGRWWYSTCYEKGLFATDNSIWNNHALLRECEKQGTSFRLLICHAQKPTQTRRRTVSV